jgi:hypothetical protein
MLFLPLLFIGCSKDEEPSGPASLLFINGLTDGNKSTVIEGDTTISELHAEFGLFTQYHTVYSGNQTFKLKDNITDLILANQQFNISRDKYYSLMAAGTKASTELVLIEDDLSISDSTKAYIRLINLSSNSNPMTMSITSGADLATSINYKSASDFVAVQPVKQELTIKSGSTIVSMFNVNLTVKKKYSILMYGLVNQTPKISFTTIVNK